MTAKDWALGPFLVAEPHAALQTPDSRWPPGWLRTHLTGWTLPAWLTRLNLMDGPSAGPSLADGLGRWLGWTDAIPLAAAMQATPHAGKRAVPTGPVDGAGSAAALDRELVRMRAVLVRAIEDDRETAADADFPAHRRRCLALQQAMAADITALRAQARAAVARRSPALARLAALDAVLAKALGPREQALLAMMPTLLERHFDRLRQAAGATAGDEASAGTRPAGDWLGIFRQDMQRLLRAELELRLQPVQGLVEALRSP